MKDDVRRFGVITFGADVPPEARREHGIDGITNAEQYTIEGCGYRGRSYSGEKSKGSTNERGDGKLRTDSVTQHERDKLIYDKEHCFGELTVAI